LPPVQFSPSGERPRLVQQREQRRADVKRAFQRCWTAYRERAWLQDELAPISGTSKSTFGGWAATLVDTLDTLWIMDLKAEFAEAVDATVTIDFSTASFEEINVFETTIRYLGGLLSAYDLCGDSRLLDKSLELADMLYVAFDTPNRMPILRWKVQAAAAGEAQVADGGVLVAEIGSLTLEFTRLSQITNDPKWFDAVHRIMTVFEEQQNRTQLPGMWPLSVNARDMDFASGTVFTLGAMSDSTYEYLPKMYALLGGSSSYERMYRSAMTAAEKSLFRPMLPDNADVLVAGIVHADKPNEVSLEPQGQHLACFAGGMLALGGRLMQEQGHVELGRKITDGCVWAYKHSELGIMPEVFTVVPCNNDPCVWEANRWHEALVAGAETEESSDATEIAKSRRLTPGFVTMNDRRYILRPEAIESVFILYRVTGEHELQEKAWNMWQSIKKHTETEFANAAISDMSNPTAPKSDSMESFWTAETLKYFYLVFSEPSLISLDEFVFNTEAHPFRRPQPKP
jgi:mannosyl-oligosaccharide alpha-1,2-mannosidase